MNLPSSRIRFLGTMVTLAFLTIIVACGCSRKRRHSYKPEIEPLPIGEESVQWLVSCDEHTDYKDIMRHPENYEGKPIAIEGKVLRITIPDDMKEQFGKDTIRGNIRINANPHDISNFEEWCVVYEEGRTVMPDGKILPDDEIVIGGIFKEVWHWRGKNGFGVEVSGETPVLLARFVSLQDNVEKNVRILSGKEIEDNDYDDD